MKPDKSRAINPDNLFALYKLLTHSAPVDSMKNFRERFEALEQQTKQLRQQTHSGDFSAVSGGSNRSAPGTENWAVGRLFADY
jgi:hypothetical protein